MAISKVPVTVIPVSTSVPANTSKASPGYTSTAVNCGTYYGGTLAYRIVNGTSAPGAPCSVTFQVSPDGSTQWVDIGTVGGDITISSTNTGYVPVERSFPYIRAIVYGHTTNAVSVDAVLHAVTAL